MSFHWSLYVDLADALIREAGQLADAEVCQRAAISRAYYGAFCTARDLALSRDNLQLTQSGQDHGIVIRHFRGSNDRLRQSVGVELDHKTP